MPADSTAAECRLSNNSKSNKTDRARQKNRTRRRFLTVAGSTVVGFAGCSGNQEDGGDQDQSTSEPKTADEISVLAVTGEGELFQRLIDERIQDETGVNVSVSLFPYNNLQEKINSITRAQNQSFDVFFMDDPWFPRFASDLDPITKWTDDIPWDKFIQTTVDIVTWPPTKGPVVPSAQGQEPKRKGLVMVGNTQLYVYNTKHFEQVGEERPETWDDVLRAGKKIKDQVEDTSGYVIRGKRGNPINANFFSLGMSRAGDMFSEEWEYRWDESQGVDTLDFYVNDLKDVSSDGVSSFDSDQVLQRIGNGTASQSPAWPAVSSLLLNPDEAEEAENLEFIPIPEGVRRAPLQGNWIAGINKHSDDAKKRAAGKVLSEFVSKESQERYVEVGGVPFRRDTFQDNMDAQPWFPALFESLQTAQWRPRTPLWTEVALTQGEWFNTALTDEATPEEAMTAINDEVEQLLENDDYL